MKLSHSGHVIILILPSQQSPASHKKGGGAQLGRGEREPGIHRWRMRLIISNFCRFLRHRRLPTSGPQLAS